ncbi:nagb/rpia/CoA transferase-like protein [Cadophora sp. DSE1049]|nr:nagb/rpia/CoA transferase-like protein [Cadophora sp. DSE1049]
MPRYSSLPWPFSSKCLSVGCYTDDVLLLQCSLDIAFAAAASITSPILREMVPGVCGKWAVCSGSIDPSDSSPQAAAKREILEETKLSDSDITILRRGKPFSLKDEELRTEWTIHPFAWQLKDGAREISFDWEHTEYKFVRPQDVASYDHVPQLEVGMERILVSPETEKGLAILRDDHESGAQALALKSLQILLDMVRGSELESLSTSVEFWRELRWRAWHLAKNGRPSMGAAIEAKLFKTLELVNRELQVLGSDTLGIPLSNLKGVVESVLEYKIAEGKQSLEPIGKAFLEYVKSNWDVDDEGKLPKSTKIVTLSASGTTHACLTSLIEALSQKGMSINITFLESRPNFEGATAATAILSSFADKPEVLKNLSIEIIPDASVATAVVDADYVIFGGDKVIPNGNVSNKIGSCAAAVTAKALNPACKVVALFETDKITGSGFDSEYLTVESNDEAEITSSWPADVRSKVESKHQDARIKVKNEYFEWVPAKYIDVHITEQGILLAEDISRLGFEKVELEKRLFGDL